MYASKPKHILSVKVAQKDIKNLVEIFGLQPAADQLQGEPYNGPFALGLHSEYNSLLCSKRGLFGKSLPCDWDV